MNSTTQNTTRRPVDTPDRRSALYSARNRSIRIGRQRRGAALILGLFLIMSLAALMAFTIDYGNIHVATTELRRSADAAAMAACWEMLDKQRAGHDSGEIEASVVAEANQTAAANLVRNQASQFADEDVQLGTYGVDQSWSTVEPERFNAVRVTLRRVAGNNGEVPLFFGALTGRESQSMERTATAAMLTAISGFYVPPDADSNLGFLPIALDEPSWLDVVNGATEDNFSADGGVSSGSDGLCEINLYPQGTGLPGNRGTVDVGGANNSTNDIARQVLHGISPQDLLDLGIPLEFDANGELLLNGDTGISAGIKDELASIIGQTRIIPIYSAASGNGNNSMFTIVRFEGVRILDVKLTGKGNQKRVIVQPAKVIARYAKIDYTGEHNSEYLVAPVMLVE